MATKGIDCVKRDVCLFYDGKFTLCVDCGHYLAEAHSTAPNNARDEIVAQMLLMAQNIEYVDQNQVASSLCQWAQQLSPVA